MAEYLYRNSNGDERTIHARMTSPPPETVAFDPDTGHWQASDGNVPGTFRRVYTCASVRASRGSEVNYGDQAIPQASRSLTPTTEDGTVVNRFGRNVRQLSNGHYATLDGRRIVDSPAARDAHMKETGAIAGD